jgi:hypothetical protein
MAAIDPRTLMWTGACELIVRAERLHRQFFQPRVEPVRDVYWEPPIEIVEPESEVLVTIAFPASKLPPSKCPLIPTWFPLSACAVQAACRPAVSFAGSKFLTAASSAR